MIESWKDLKKYKSEIETHKVWEIYNYDYQDLIKEIYIDIEIGKERKEIEINDTELLEKYKEKFKLDNDYVIIYTDGLVTKTRINTGIGIAMEDSDIGYKISINKKCSIFTAEVIAIEKALGYAQEQIENKDILILTDSQSVCKAIKNNNINVHQNDYIYKIRKRISEYEENRKRKEQKKCKIVIGWIPSHIGIIGNEAVHKLAKEATEEDKDDRIKVPKNDWKTVRQRRNEEQDDQQIRSGRKI